jgi:hypothetical protein
MLLETIQAELTTKIVTDPQKILRHLQIGISIPILQEFHKYILRDLEAYNAKAIMIEESFNLERFQDKTDKVVAISIIYDDGSDTLFFGFCGAYDHDPIKIEMLCDEILQYARDNGYKFIRGPINVPTVIFGWGFMVEGSNKDLFISCPVNPPIYQTIFLERGFTIKFKEARLHVPLLKYYPERIKNKDGSPKYTFSDYEYINPSKETIWEVLDDIIQLHIDHMPPSAQITPHKSTNARNIVEFIHENAYEAMIWTVYYKPAKKMIACGYVIPNPFSRDTKGRLDSMSFHDWVVDPNHRRSGVAMLMYARTADQCYKNGIRWGSWVVGEENIPSITSAKKMGGKQDRSHLILEYIL